MGWTSLITPPSCLIFVLWEAISDVIWSGTVMSVAPSIWEVQVHWYIRSVIRTGYSSSHWTWRLLDAVARLWIVEGLCFHLHPPTGGSRWSLTHWGISDFWEGGWCEGLTEVMGNRCLLVAEMNLLWTAPLRLWLTHVLCQVNLLINNNINNEDVYALTYRNL